MELTIIIPAFNESEGIGKTIEELIPVANDKKWKLIVINDGSVDSTEKEILKYSEVKLINHPYNKGYGASLKTGIKHAKTEYIALYDADGQHRTEDLISLADNVGQYDMIIGERGKDSHREWVRRPGKWIISKVANYLVGKKITDLNSGLRVVKRDVILKILHLFPDGFSFSTTSTIAFINMGFNLGYYPIKVNRRTGKSSVRQIKHGSSVILLILRLIILFNPLKVFIPVSVILFAIGVIYEIIWGIILIPHIKVITGALLLILSSIVIFFFGLMTDQISETRKYLNIKN